MTQKLSSGAAEPVPLILVPVCLPPGKIMTFVFCHRHMNITFLNIKQKCELQFLDKDVDFRKNIINIVALIYEIIQDIPKYFFSI